MGRSKHRKKRGNRTHGRGMKAGRGKGKRGGKGLSGTSKHRFVWTLKNRGKRYFGIYGFKRPQKIIKTDLTINIRDLRNLDPGDNIKREGDTTVVDLHSMGIDKLLGKGLPSGKYRIRVGKASAGAVKKIEEAGGKVEIVSIKNENANSGPKK